MLAWNNKSLMSYNKLMTFSHEYFILYTSILNVTLFAAFWFVFHYGFIFVLSFKKPPAHKDNRQSIAFKEHVTDNSSIKQPLSEEGW